MTDLVVKETVAMKDELIKSEVLENVKDESEALLVNDKANNVCGDPCIPDSDANTLTESKCVVDLPEDKIEKKLNSLEHSHRFLNKSVTIAAEDRGTNDIFVPAGIAAGYAWNSAPKDSTDILRSIPAISRELHFPLDIILSALPKFVNNSGQSALDYLKLTDSSKKHLISNCIMKSFFANPLKTSVPPFLYKHRTLNVSPECIT